MLAKREIMDGDNSCLYILQVREGVRSLAEALNLAQAVKECQSLKLRGIMTHHGRLEVFLPIVEAVRSNVSQVSALSRCVSTSAPVVIFDSHEEHR